MPLKATICAIKVIDAIFDAEHKPLLAGHSAESARRHMLALRIRRHEISHTRVSGRRRPDNSKPLTAPR